MSMIDKNSIQQFILDYIADNTQDETIDITPDTDFVTSRLLDSFSILNLIMTLESEYDIKFDIIELANPKIRVVSALGETVFLKCQDT